MANNYVYGTGGNDYIKFTCTDGPDYIFAYGGSDTIHALGGDDFIMGGDGNDYVFGEGGNDLLKGGGGADYLSGGPGIDTAAYNDFPAGVIVFLYFNSAWSGDAEGDQFDGIENLSGSAYGDHLLGDDGVNVLQGWGGNDQLDGYGGDDNLWGGLGNDNLFGQNGADTMHGEDGNDYLMSGPGHDNMIGGTGNDTYFVESIFDTVTESGGEGSDVVTTIVSYTLPTGSDIETLETTDASGAAAINLTGNANGNQLIGNNGANILNGGNGNDELTGYGGADSFLFNTPLSAAFNVDVITDFTVADDTIWLDDDVFSSSLGLGNISAGELVIGAAAQDANDRIIYNSATGALSYDSDGVGGTAAIQFAALSTGLALTYLDFLVVA